MKFKLQKYISFLLVLAIASAFTACGVQNTEKPKDNTASDQNTTIEAKETPKEKIKLRMYTDIADNIVKVPHDYALEKLSKEMPEVEIVHEQFARDDYLQLKTFAAAGNLPDIYESSVKVLSAFLKSGNVLSLDKYVEELGIMDKIAPANMNLLIYPDGHIYSMPRDGQKIALIYYNKELFEKNGVKVPENYDEFLAAVKVFSEKGVIPLGLFAKEKWPGVQFFDVIASRMEPEGVKKLDLGKGKITEEAYVKAAQKIHELVKAGLLAKGAFNTDYDQALALFLEGKTAMFLNGSWALEDIGNGLGDKAGLLYYPLQDAASTETARWNMSGGEAASGFSVSPHTANLDVTARYCILYGYYNAEGGIVKGVSGSPLMKNPPASEIELSALTKLYTADSVNFKSMTAFPWGLSNSVVGTALEDNVQKLLTGSDSYLPENFIKDIGTALDKAFGK